MATPKSDKKESSDTSFQPVMTIKHGEDPEVQEVNIAASIQKGLSAIENLKPSPENIHFIKKTPKSMTTKSTMTNEDDYTVVHTNTPCTSPSPSLRENDAIDDDNQDVIDARHKIVGWKMTPRVHFPPPNTINASSLRTASMGRVHDLPQTDAREFNPIIEPPYLHRPDRTLIVHQTKPLPLQPVKAWPGYGGNVYFQPFKAVSKPIRDRTYSSRTPVRRSRSVSSYPPEKLTTTPDLYSVSKLSSFHFSSPSFADSKITPSRFASETLAFDEIEDDISKRNRRQMAHLDKNFVLSMSGNTKFTEDWTWISGKESLGTLKIGNPLLEVRRHSNRERYNRQTVVEKVPHNFVFHSQKENDIEKTISAKIREKTNARNSKAFTKDYGLPKWVLQQFADQYYRDNRGQLQLPRLPLRVKGRKVTNENKVWKIPY
ncbi:uncharacterized protein LOC143458778 isoform X2 [Clavelina lepadiformis]|uniref:uncharacterized protein LOC143458778 isoform X2 n=1 Tax=Clavelina lepadiformis TaxID=159417 RepID=UPI0040420727